MKGVIYISRSPTQACKHLKFYITQLPFSIFATHLSICIRSDCWWIEAVSVAVEERRGEVVLLSSQDGSRVIVEPRRKSCDVRARSSLSSLFGMDDGGDDKGGNFMNETVCRNGGGKVEEVGVGEIRVLEEGEFGGDGCEIEHEEWRTMKEHTDLECRSKKVKKGKDLKNIAGSIWGLAASGFSKKLQKWRQKQKMRMQQQSGNVGSLNRVGISVERMNVRHWRETQSEVGDYGFGRRSCDTEPRFSVDAGRASVDCGRFSLDEPRASWDGYLIGRSSVHRPNQMLAVVEDDDHYVEDVISVKSGNGIDKSPGGTEQTRDYYGEGVTRRRRSLDKSGSRTTYSIYFV